MLGVNTKLGRVISLGERWNSQTDVIEIICIQLFSVFVQFKAQSAIAQCVNLTDGFTRHSVDPGDPCQLMFLFLIPKDFVICSDLLFDET